VFLREEAPVSILFRVAYDGSGFFGWEKQPDLPTVQGTLEATLAAVTGIRARTLAASRTDAGVHAEDQLVAWHTEACRIPLERLPEVLNRKLPPTVQIRAAAHAPPHFDPRRHVRAKTYTYASGS
jgi:tRNA pseudouridine38-40 synthase